MLIDHTLLQNSERSEGHERSECLMSTIIFYILYIEKSRHIRMLFNQFSYPSTLRLTKLASLVIQVITSTFEIITLK